jgi:hypothetical protein
VVEGVGFEDEFRGRQSQEERKESRKVDFERGKGNTW